MRLQAFLALPLVFSLTACEGEPSAEPEDEGGAEVEIVLPTAGDVDAIEAAADKAGDDAEANPEETLEELEKMIGEEEDQ